MGTTSNPSKYLVDGVLVDGLEGVVNSLSYRVHEIERHLHSRERWFGAAAVPNAEIHVADNILTSPAPFVADAGNNTWGTWLQVLGSSDTPSIAGSTHFDPHRFMVTAAEHDNTTYLVQIASGTSGDVGLAAGTYTETVFHTTGNKVGAVPAFIQTVRIAAGTKAWVRLWARTKDTGTLTFYFGLHEYEG